MSTKEHPDSVSTTQRSLFRISLITILALSLAGAAFGQTIPQIGLKFGINGLYGLQSTNVGAPGYAQTNWNVLGYRGDNIGISNAAFNVLDSSGANSGVAINWTGANVWSVANGGTQIG